MPESLPQLGRYQVDLLLTLSPQELDNQFGDLALVIGPNLADQVDTAVQEYGLGYYPALDYFHHAPGIDEQLLSAAEHIYSMVALVVSQTVRADLREGVRAVEIISVRALAETLPRIRPGQVDSLFHLARHYAPMSTRVRFHGALRNMPEPGLAPEQSLEREVDRALRAHFSGVEVVHVSPT
jgi:hypothetical protein